MQWHREGKTKGKKIEILWPDVFLDQIPFTILLPHLSSGIHCGQLHSLATGEQANKYPPNLGVTDISSIYKSKLVPYFKVRIQTLKFIKNFIEKTVGNKISLMSHTHKKNVGILKRGNDKHI